MSPPRARTRRPALTALMVATLATCLALVVLRARPAAREANAAFVIPRAGATWSQAREGRVERVVLSDGDLTLYVRKQAANERFLVVVPDGEVEVRGTTFEVAVHDGHAARVHVDEGVVEVRVGGTATLHAGETWHRPTAESVVAEARVASEASPVVAPVSPSPPRDLAIAASAVPLPQRPTPARVVAVAARPRETAGSNTHELSDYARAVDAYRAAHFEDAAELLDAFSVTYPASSFLDDASFLEASSLANAGRSDAAALLAERHLARFPSSFHRKEAAILVARLRRDRGDCDGARKATAPWLDETPQDPRVMTALGGCAIR